MEKHVTSLEISKKLKELGVKQESVFDWCRGKVDTKQQNAWCFQNKYPSNKECWKDGHVSAFLASELGELLPIKYLTGRGVDEEDPWNVWQFDDLWMMKNYNDYRSITMPDAMGKMLIYLLENNLTNL